MRVIRYLSAVRRPSASVLDVGHALLGAALNLLDLALCFLVPVAGQLAEPFLDLTLGPICGAWRASRSSNSSSSRVRLTSRHETSCPSVIVGWIWHLREDENPPPPLRSQAERPQGRRVGGPNPSAESNPMTSWPDL